jgi:4-hydroxyacetophenone monooxygenase
MALAAIREADPNILRMALLQLTGDPTLEQMEVVTVPVRGGVLLGDALAERHHDEVRRRAFEYLKANPATADVPPPSKEEAYRLLQLFSASPLDDRELAYGYEELALEPFPRDVQWRDRPAQKVIDQFKILIVGAGISGIATAVMLNRLGIPYSIVERNEGIGGTWWINDYPEARVDVTSYLYQYKFEKNYPWSSYYANRDETLEYLQFIAQKYGVIDHVELKTEVMSADWDEGARSWNVVTRNAGGDETSRTVNVVISASGLFSTPKLPDIVGIETFAGAIFHTTQWDHSYDYEGKRIGLIGNGSTGSQLMPRLAETAGKLTVFQRTAQWVMPAENYKASIPPAMQWLFDHVPFYWNWYCYACFAATARLQDLQQHDREWQAKGGLINERNDKLRQSLLKYIESKVGDRPDLHEKLLPTFAPLGRRSVVDNGWYDALRRDNVELVTTSIKEITPAGVVTDDGTVHQLDMLVLAAGFQTSRYLFPVRYAGRNGVTIEDAWRHDGPRSYLGLTIPQFPNFFICYGPNSQPRSAGFYAWAEIWGQYCATMIAHMIENNLSEVEVKQDVFDQYNDELDREMPNLIWESEAKGSYYINEHGRMSVNAPWRIADYHARARYPNFDDFIFD